MAHSSVHGAVMFPYGGGYEKNFKLHQDDIGIRVYPLKGCAEHDPFESDFCAYAHSLLV